MRCCRGNTADCTMLRDALRKIEGQYGKADRIWIMDRGIPSDEVLAEMRKADPPVSCLVGTPKGRLSKLEKALLKLPGQAVREEIDVKLLPRDQEITGWRRATHASTRNAPCGDATQMAMGASQADRGNGESLTRGTAHEARRRALQSQSGMASDRCRGGPTLRARLKPLTPRPHAEGRARQARRHPDARRSLPHDRWPRADPEPLHRTQHRSNSSSTCRPSRHRASPQRRRPTRVVTQPV
jgi:hypothetical protein